MIDLKVCDVLINTKNDSTGEIQKISRTGIATILCYEKILGFFKTTDELVTEVATRTAHVRLLEKGIETGLLKLKSEVKQ